MKVAVIGGGIFGSVVAWRLSNSGFGVDLFEQGSALLSGSTPKSVMRLHLGLHYPRDLETAIQSREGYYTFLREFGACVDLNFRNYYAIAKEGSKVSTDHFIEFAKISGIPMERQSKLDLVDSGFAVNQVKSVFSSPEGVISPDLLRNELASRLDGNSVELHLNTEITGASLLGAKWALKTDDENNFRNFDFVVVATYGMDRIKLAPMALRRSPLEFQKTLVLRANLGLGSFGMTVIDGDFLTVLPVAFEKTHLVYAPRPSVLGRLIANPAPKEFLSWTDEDTDSAQVEIMSRYREWFPDAPIPSLFDKLSGFRAIQVGVEATDRRPTEVAEVAPGMFSILSGKINHSIGISDKLLGILSRKRP